MKQLIPYLLIFVVMFLGMSFGATSNENTVFFHDPQPNKIHIVNPNDMTFDFDRHFCVPTGVVYEDVVVERHIENGVVYNLSDDYVGNFPPAQAGEESPLEEMEGKMECFIMTLSVEIPPNVTYGVHDYVGEMVIPNKYYGNTRVAFPNVKFVFVDPTDVEIPTTKRVYEPKVKRLVRETSNKSKKHVDKVE